MKAKPSLMALAIGTLAILLVGCQQSSKQQAENPPPPEETQATGKTSSQSRKATPRTSGERTKAPAQHVERVERFTVPAGTPLEVRLTDGIDTGKTSQGAAFEGSLASALVVNGLEVVPVGSTVTGRVTNVVSSGRLNRPAELSLVLNSLTPEGGSRTEIATNAWSRKGPSHKKRDIEMIGGGAGVGAVIGAIAGKGKGAAIGSAVGAGAGTAGAAITGKKEIVLAPETKLTFTLSAPITLTKR